VAGFSRRAKADISEIWQYTVDHWGADQASLYLELLDAAIDEIDRNPKVGRPCNEIRHGYRKHLIGSHVVFYRMKDREVFVVRVLHQRMDPGRHF